jgi:hypothetical protein
MPFIYSSTLTNNYGVDSTSPIPIPPVGSWTRPLGVDNGQSGGGITLSRHFVTKHIEYVPFKPQYNMTFSDIAIRFFNINSCTDTWTYRLGIYTSNDNYPYQLITDYGALTVDPAVTSPGMLAHTGLSTALTGGQLYWLACGINYSGTTDLSNNRTPIMGLMIGDYVNMRRRGMTASNVGLDGISFIEQPGVYAGGSLPTSTSPTNLSVGFAIAVRPLLKRSV